MADLFRVLNAQQDVFLRANIVVAVDDETADQEVFLGRAKMKELMAGALAIEVSPEPIRFSDYRIVTVPIDFKSDEYDQLAVACVIMKGHCDIDEDEPDEEDEP